jgi:spore coat polysaccharide biosynthesis protein SpsF
MIAGLRTVAIVQARMTSTRLPGKVLLPILGQPMLALQIERMRRAQLVDLIVVATTINAFDEPIVDFCKQHALPCFRGSEDDVLSRYAQAAIVYEADAIMRITSDCPLIEPALMNQAVSNFAQAQGQLDYISNMLKPTFPYGLAVEIFSREALRQAQACAVQPAEREHVTPYIYRHPEQFRLQNISYSADLSHHRWTVDTPEDFDLVSKIFSVLYPNNPQFNMQDVLNLLEENVAWPSINQHVKQKIPN